MRQRLSCTATQRRAPPTPNRTNELRASAPLEFSREVFLRICRSRRSAWRMWLRCDAAQSIGITAEGKKQVLDFELGHHGGFVFAQANPVEHLEAPVLRRQRFFTKRIDELVPNLLPQTRNVRTPHTRRLPVLILAIAQVHPNKTAELSEDILVCELSSGSSAGSATSKDSSQDTKSIRRYFIASSKSQAS